MSIIIRNRVPSDEKRRDIECVTLSIVRLTTDNEGRKSVCVHLDEGLSTEREVTWAYAVDHPVFIFKRDVAQ